MSALNSPSFVPNVPGSRSIAARALVCASLAKGESVVANTPVCDDTTAISNCIKYLSADVSVTGDVSSITGWGHVTPSGEVLDCNASGTTMRFIAALSLLTSVDVKLTGTTRLLERPMGGLTDVLTAIGKTAIDANGQRIISGTPNLPLELTVDASKSGQFVSGLLMALAASGQAITLRALNPVSIPFITMTVTVMKSFGAQLNVIQDDSDLVFTIAGTGYQPINYQVEPDIMSANYFLAAAAISGKSVFIPGINKDTMQGDVALVYALEKMGATIEFVDGGIKATRDLAIPLTGCEVDLAEMPDMSLTIAVLAALANSPTTMTSARILKFKESDRLNVIVTELTKIGAQVDVSADGDTITIRPANHISAASVDTYEDHRVAMAFGLLTLVEPNIVINDPECVSKTWPEFFSVLAAFQKS